MADDTDTPRPFDVKTIKFLVNLMSRNDLSEMDLQEGNLRIRLRRGTHLPPGATVAMSPVATAAPAAAPVVAPAAAPAAEKESTESAPAKKLLEIKSPTIGTFYAQPEPGSPEFVSVGSKVTPDTVVGIVEAMKVFNEIPAGCSGVIAEICVENQQPVEYDQVLFRVDPSA